MEVVATTSLPAVDRPNADRWNAARSRQNVTFQKAERIGGGIGEGGSFCINIVVRS